MQQLIILIVALALAGGVYLFLTISKKKSKEQTEENAVEMMTANEMINVKDIRNNCLHTNDGYTFTFIEIGGMSMELFSESEKLAYCKNITSIVSRFQFPYKYMAISSPYVIKHMVTADSNRLKNASIFRLFYEILLGSEQLQAVARKGKKVWENSTMRFPILSLWKIRRRRRM